MAKPDLVSLDERYGKRARRYQFPDISNLQHISPTDYFQSSGDANLKAEKLLRDCYSLAAKCSAFRNKLKRFKATHLNKHGKEFLYLEYTPYDGRVLRLVDKREKEE